jgi:hypothetical protein
MPEISLGLSSWDRRRQHRSSDRMPWSDGVGQRAWVSCLEQLRPVTLLGANWQVGSLCALLVRTESVEHVQRISPS